MQPAIVTKRIHSHLPFLQSPCIPYWSNRIQRWESPLRSRSRSRSASQVEGRTGSRVAWDLASSTDVFLIQTAPKDSQLWQQKFTAHLYWVICLLVFWRSPPLVQSQAPGQNMIYIVFSGLDMTVVNLIRAAVITLMKRDLLTFSHEEEGIIQEPQSLPSTVLCGC